MLILKEQREQKPHKTQKCLNMHFQNHKYGSRMEMWEGTSMTYNKNFIITTENLGNFLCHIHGKMSYKTRLCRNTSIITRFPKSFTAGYP
jgi:hypothetical protein